MQRTNVQKLYRIADTINQTAVSGQTKREISTMCTQIGNFWVQTYGNAFSWTRWNLISTSKVNKIVQQKFTGNSLVWLSWWVDWSAK